MVTPDLGPEAADNLLDALAGEPTAGGPLDPSLDAVIVLLAAAAADLDEPVDPSPVLLSALVGAARGLPAPTLLRRVVPVAVVAVGLLAGTGVAAAAGSLPDPVQDVAHNVAGLVGVDVPTAAEADEPGNGIGRDGVPPGQGGIVPGTGAEGGGNGIGSDGVPPGQGGTVPGTGADGGGNGIGSDGVPPGQGGTVPGTDAEGGGNGTTDPGGVGSDGTPPGQGGSIPADGNGNGVGSGGVPPTTGGSNSGNGNGHENP